MTGSNFEPQTSTTTVADSIHSVYSTEFSIVFIAWKGFAAFTLNGFDD